MIDPETPTLFGIGEEIFYNHNVPRCPRMYGVCGYWPRGNYWSVFDKWWDFDEFGEERAKIEAKEFAKEKSKSGWIKCRLILFEGIRD